MNNLSKNLLNTKYVYIIFSILILLLISLALRIPDLGYSHFYGDEIKTLYLRKDVPAMEFLLNQRKGPVQFLVVWFVEKITGGFSPEFVRLPFALAGVAVIPFLYLFVLNLTKNSRISFLTSLFYSLSGVYIAFSRTAQYQSFLMLFGVVALFFLSSIHQKKNSRIFLLVSSVFLSLSMLSHYDAVFFLIPILFLISTLTRQNILEIKSLLVFFVFPFVSITSLFYVPYVLRGYMELNTFGYVSKRFLGTRYLPSYSVYTQGLYNPINTWLVPFVLSIISFLQINSVKKILVMWFLIPFIFFEFFVSNPGTHIHNYFIPMFMLAAYVLDDIFLMLSQSYLKAGFYALVAIYFAVYFIIQGLVFTPALNTEYPWKYSKILNLSQNKISREYQVFAYGFPYNRGWDQIYSYFSTKGWPRSFYTNDNTVIAAYYLNNSAVHVMNTEKLPQYYINIIDNQEAKSKDDMVMDYYVLTESFYLNNKLVAEIYKFDPANAPNSRTALPLIK